jgi:hypothetical protein
MIPVPEFAADAPAKMLRQVRLQVRTESMNVNGLNLKLAGTLRVGHSAGFAPNVTAGLTANFAVSLTV